MTSLLKFTPDRMDGSDIEAVHAGRVGVLESVMKRIRNIIRSGGTMHVIFTGRRGMGKTHALGVIRHRLSDCIVPVTFSQEEYSMTTIGGFFSRVLDALGEDHDGTDPTDRARGVLKRYRAEGRMVIIFAENLQMLFAQMQADLGKLRAVIQEDESFFIVGSALDVFEQVSSMDAAFYNFFEINRLDGLDAKEIRELIQKRLRSKKALADRIRANERGLDGLRALTGGNPRLIHALCDEMIGKDSAGAPEDGFVVLLDQMTPMYQTRTAAMSAETRKIFDALAAADGPLTPTELARMVNSKSSVMTAQINRMKNDGIVEPVKFRKKKETRYQVTERLYRMWREFRMNRGSARLEAFVGFLILWYSKDELDSEYERVSDMFGHAARRSGPAARGALRRACRAPAAAEDQRVARLRGTTERLLRLGELEHGRVEIKNCRREAESEPDPAKLLCKEVMIGDAELLVCEPGQDQRATDALLGKMQELDRALQARAWKPRGDAGAHALLWGAARAAGEFGDWKLARSASGAALACCEAYCHSCTVLNASARINLEEYSETLDWLDSVLERPERLEDGQAAEILACRIQIHAKTGDCGRAASDARRMLERDAAMIDHAVRAFFELGKIDDALAVLRDSADGLRRADAGDLRASVGSVLLTVVRHATRSGLDEQETDAIVGCLEALKPVAAPHMFVRAAGFLAKHSRGADMDRCLKVLSRVFDDGQLGPMRTLKYAADYIRTGDTDPLEKLHPEQRALAVSMIRELSPQTNIPRDVLHSIRG